MAFFFLSPGVRRLLALGLSGAAPAAAFAQTPDLGDVVVVARPTPVFASDRAAVSVWDVTLARTPQSISVLGADLIETSGSTMLSQLVRLDAALSDSYNTTGYLESLSVRGFLLDSGANYLRNGLATSNYAPLALENMERVEVLKGVAALQAGVSAPGGLVNLVSKLPTREPLTMLTAQTDSEGGSSVHLDASRNFGIPGETAPTGVRLNLVREELQPAFNDARGARTLASLAVVSQWTRATRVQFELEYQRKRQPSVPGLGLLDSNGDGVADALPAPIPQRLNLNNQPWSQPFEFEGTMIQLGATHALRDGWEAGAALTWQRSTINDHIAFADGCSSAPVAVYPGLCGNGDVDIYDYRSDGEVRTLQGYRLQLGGPAQAFGLQHQLRFGLDGHTTRADLAPYQAYNFVGTSNIFNPVVLPADPSLTVANTDTRETATALFATLQTTWSDRWQSFAGLRETQLSRSSARSDGSEAVDLAQTLGTPWLGVSWTFTQNAMAYASWGQGVELEMVPNRPLEFANAGAALPALRSDQIELGLKLQPTQRTLFTAAVFRIHKPYADDLVDTSGLKTRVAGAKQAQHQGLELGLTGAVTPQMSLQASMAWLDARYQTAITPALVGQQVTNVPAAKLSIFGDYKLAALPGFSVHGLLVAERGKRANADGSVVLPDAWQLDTGLRYRTAAAGRPLTWTLQAQNLTDRIYWREAPTQSWGASYLFASTPRTLSAGVSVEF